MGNGRTENRQDERVGSKYCSWWQPSLGLHRLAPLVSNTAARAALRGVLVGLCRPLESLWAGEGAPPDPGASLASGWLGFFHPAPHSQRAKSGDPEMLLGPQGQCRSSSSTASCTLWPFSPGPAPLHLHEVPLGGFGVISTRTAQTSNSKAGKTCCNSAQWLSSTRADISGDPSFSWLCWAVIPRSMPQFPLPPLPSSLERALPCANIWDPLQDGFSLLQRRAFMENLKLGGGYSF